MSKLVDPSDLMTTDQAAYEIGVCRRTLEKWKQKGIAPLGVDICGKAYFFKSALQFFQPPGQGKRNDLTRTN